MGKDFDIEKLSGSDNYHTWSFEMENYLEYKGYGDCIKTKTGENGQIVVVEQEVKKLVASKALIVLCLQKSMHTHIRKCESALEVWNMLKKMYEDKGLSRKIGILRTMLSTRLDDCDNMQQYVDQVMGGANKLQGIGFEITDEWLGAILLAGLTEKYQPLIMALETMSNELKSDVIISKLLDAEPAGAASSDAFFSKGGRPKKGQSQRKCYGCGSTDHLKNNCNKKEKTDSTSNQSKAAFLAMMAESEQDNDWYLDSGSSNHATPRADYFSSIDKNAAHEIRTANNSTMKACGVGTIDLKIGETELVMKNVLHLPECAANLLSVSKICEKGNKVIFDIDGCRIYSGNDKLLMQCKPRNGVYKFRADESRAFLASKRGGNLELWHKRLGHLNYDSMRRMRDGAVTGIDFESGAIGLFNCEVCAEGKQHRLPFEESHSTTEDVLELVHSDVAGPMETVSIGGARYMLTFIDDYSRKNFLYFLKRKSDVYQTFLEFKAFVENQTGKKLKTLRTDKGTEYFNNNLINHCKSQGILHQSTQTFTPQQNGVAERCNRTLEERGRCLLFEANLPKKFWAEAVHMASYLMNRSVNSSSADKTPEELWSGKKVDLSNLRLFGSPVMVHVPKQKRKKWDKKSEKFIFTGYDATTKGFRCIDPNTNKFVISRDVIFHEDVINAQPEVDGGSAVSKGEEMSKAKATKVCKSSNNNIVSGRVVVDMSDEVDDTTENQFQEGNGDPMNESEDIVNFEDANDESIETSNAADTDPSIIVLDDTTATENSSANETNSEYDMTYIDDVSGDPDYVPPTESEDSFIAKKSPESKLQPNSFNLIHFAYFAEPTSVKEATQGNEAEQWNGAMHEEMDSLLHNQTWTLTELPPGRKAIRSKWVFKLKRDQQGNIARYKARLVAKGCSQVKGIDYDETFSPVVRYASLRFLFALAVKKGLRCHQMDAITAYLHGELDEDIFMQQPEGYQDGSSRVCKLNRGIYGLKQAGRLWNLKLDKALTKFGLTKSKLDPCIYYNKSIDLIVAIYVDDFLIFYESIDNLNGIKEYLHQMFRMKDIGDVTSCLGMRVSQTENSIEIDQERYILDILERFGMSECKPIGTPRDTHQKLSTEQVTDDNSLVGKVPFQEAVGSLLYLAQATRPDIAFAVNDISRFNNRHTTIHWTAVKRILRYLKGTISMKLRFTRSGPMNIHCYTDSDWASDIDSRRSCAGHVVIMSNGAISWSSKKQRTVALSSTEAEYMALSTAACDVLWVKQLAQELDSPSNDPTIILCDNESTINLGKNDAFRPRTKHIDIRFHHLRKKISTGFIDIKHVSTHKNAADFLTKAVTQLKHKFCATRVGLTQASD